MIKGAGIVSAYAALASGVTTFPNKRKKFVPKGPWFSEEPWFTQARKVRKIKKAEAKRERRRQKLLARGYL